MKLLDFILQSNLIEGIERPPLESEISAHERLLELPSISISDLVEFVRNVQPGASLRNLSGMDVMVGRYRAPRGGSQIVETLERILSLARQDGDEHEVFMVHYLYENLHPFTDGNGRSGRALWLWMMRGESTRLFLHEWYYQSLRTQIRTFEPHPNLLPARNSQ